ncbi:MAG: hypothetical protein KDD32_04145 [Bacteroidetes bacterium]|nr:hypothetical protein [Bacteroidota bacterium]
MDLKKSSILNQFIGLSVLCVVLTASCINDKTAGPIGVNPSVPNLTHPGFWIVNEGGFTFGQASLSFLDLVEDSMYNKVFEGVNRRPLGDVFQSINYYQGKAFLTVNNSQKIEVVDSITFESIATITGLNSPREVLGFHNELFVTDLYADQITVLDATTYAIKDKIEVGGWTNKMLLHENKLYVTIQQILVNNIPGSRKGMLVIDPIDHSVEHYYPLSQGCNSLVVDKNNRIWALCDGGLEEEIGGIFKINPLSETIETSIYFQDETYSASSLQINTAKDELYFIVSDPDDGINAFDIMQLSVMDNEWPAETWLDGGQLYIYGFILNEDEDEFYLNDAVGLLQEGFCYRYRFSDQSLIKKYKTGIFPSEFSQRK